MNEDHKNTILGQNTSISIFSYDKKNKIVLKVFCIDTPPPPLLSVHSPYLSLAFFLPPSQCPFSLITSPSLPSKFDTGTGESSNVAICIG